MGLILPKDLAFREEYDMSHLAEYSGPRYDDPEQLAEVRRRLGTPAVAHEVDSTTP